MARAWILSTDSAVRHTLGRMSRAVRLALNDPDFVWWARDILKYVPERDYRGQAMAVRAFVARSIRFARDPLGVESITRPQEHQKRLQAGGFVLGDCDDAATLAAALGMSVGLRGEFTVLAFNRPDAPYQHVYTTLVTPAGEKVECDTTRAANQLPPVPTRRHTVNV